MSSTAGITAPKCVVCMEFISPPVFICQNGCKEMVCSNCLENLDECPICRGATREWVKLYDEPCIAHILFQEP